MTSLITHTTTTRGKPALMDINCFSYTANGKGGEHTQPWRCCHRSCLATLRTNKKTGLLVGDKLPIHNHANNLLKQVAQATEKQVLDKYKSVPSVSSAAVLQDISKTMLSSVFPGQLSSASTAGSIRMKLWRQRQSDNPRPPIPSNFQEFMETEIPEKYSRTADGGQFMVYREWIDDAKSLPLVIFISQWGADILARHSVWMFDGTFDSCPLPFAQVYKIMCNFVFT